ncbi:MAG: hypothetical protein ACI9YT_001007, partial [Halobacteriales archaeon]
MNNTLPDETNNTKFPVKTLSDEELPHSMVVL